MSKFYEALETAKKRNRLREVAPKTEQRPKEAEAADETEVSSHKDMREPLQQEKTVSLFRNKPVFSKELVIFNEPDSEVAEYFRFLRSFVIHPVDKEPATHHPDHLRDHGRGQDLRYEQPGRFHQPGRGGKCPFNRLRFAETKYLQGIRNWGLR